MIRMRHKLINRKGKSKIILMRVINNNYDCPQANYEIKSQKKRTSCPKTKNLPMMDKQIKEIYG